MVFISSIKLSIRPSGEDQHFFEYTRSNNDSFSQSTLSFNLIRCFKAFISWDSLFPVPSLQQIFIILFNLK